MHHLIVTVSDFVSGHISVTKTIDGPPENSSELERAPGARSKGDELSGGPSIVTRYGAQSLRPVTRSEMHVLLGGGSATVYGDFPFFAFRH